MFEAVDLQKSALRALQECETFVSQRDFLRTHVFYDRIQSLGERLAKFSKKVRPSSERVKVIQNNVGSNIYRLSAETYTISYSS